MNYKKILHIDDDTDDCELFLEALQTVSSASYKAINNPVEALHKLVLREIEPDVIFLDLNMPFMSGLEFLAEIKKQEKLKEIPIIIFSTSQSNQITNEAKAYGVEDFVSKPNNFNDLKKIICQYIFTD